MWDRCPRRFAFEQKWDVKALSPTGLLYAAVEAGIVSPDPEDAAKDTAHLMASQRELQITSSLTPYVVVRHISHLAAIVSVGLREKLGKLSQVPVTTPEGFKFEWESGIFQSEDGSLHRICLADHFDDDRLRAEAHSWLTVGELAMLRRPITLHAVIIGPHRQGRRHSAWTKGLLHPMSHQLKFARRANSDGRSSKMPLSGAWEDIWREDSAISTQNWMNIMKADAVYNQLIMSREIKFNGTDRRIRTAAQDIRRIIERMPTAKPSYMMHRTSCDEMGRGACPYQRTCYSPERTTPDDFPRLFKRKTAPDEEAVLGDRGVDEQQQDQLITISSSMTVSV